MQRTAVALAQPEMLRNSQRNAGIPLRPEAFEAIQVNLSAVERRAATLTTRRTVKKEWQAAWLVKAITCIDLTTLAGDDTPGRVQRLCAKAMRPLAPRCSRRSASKIHRRRSARSASIRPWCRPRSRR